VYFNQGSLEATLAGIRQEVIERTPELRGEVIFVDDGSGDNSLTELLELQRAHPGLVRVIKLTRNFGQVSALYAGFSHARGRCVVFLSADGQDPPTSSATCCGSTSRGDTKSWPARGKAATNRCTRY
jgi:dolichol-phosphate mannosyltransferase